jgi:hypothetical protein
LGECRRKREPCGARTGDHHIRTLFSLAFGHAEY